jgi:hypothetical protein
VGVTNFLAHLSSALDPLTYWRENELRACWLGWASQFRGLKPNHNQTAPMRQYFGGANFGSQPNMPLVEINYDVVYT